MSNYTKTTNFTAKDNLNTGNPSKLILGSLFDTEYDAIATAVATKVDSSGALGTPSSGTLTSCTGLPISTGVSGLGSGVATFLATPSSANLISAVTDETGTGALVFGTSPTITTPTITGQATIGAVIETDYLIPDDVGFTIDPANGGMQRVTLGANRTPVWGGSNGEGLLLMVNDGTAYTITWTHTSFNSGAGPTWINNGGVYPTLSLTGYTGIVLWQQNSVVYGALVGNGS